MEAINGDGTFFILNNDVAVGTVILICWASTTKFEFTAYGDRRGTSGRATEEKRRRRS